MPGTCPTRRRTFHPESWRCRGLCAIRVNPQSVTCKAPFLGHASVSFSFFLGGGTFVPRDVLRPLGYVVPLVPLVFTELFTGERAAHTPEHTHTRKKVTPPPHRLVHAHRRSPRGGALCAHSAGATHPFLPARSPSLRPAPPVHTPHSPFGARCPACSLARTGAPLGIG